MTTNPKTHKEPATAIGINPKLIALARKIDDAEAKFKRVLIDVLAPAERRLFASREDIAAVASVEEAHRLEEKASEVSEKLGEKFSKIAATNLDELILKARYADDFPCIGDSIIRDLLAISGKRKASTSKEANGSQHARHP